MSDPRVAGPWWPRPRPGGRSRPSLPALLPGQMRRRTDVTMAVRSRTLTARDSPRSAPAFSQTVALELRSAASRESPSEQTYRTPRETADEWTRQTVAPISIMRELSTASRLRSLRSPRTRPCPVLRAPIRTAAIGATALSSQLDPPSDLDGIRRAKIRYDCGFLGRGCGAMSPAHTRVSLGCSTTATRIASTCARTR